MKYELGQTVFYLKDNKVHSATVLARHRVENAAEERAVTAAQIRMYSPWGPAGTYYSTCHGEYLEDYVFASKEDLAAALVASV